MVRIFLVLLFALAGGASCKGGEVAKISAAYEVPTASAKERAQLLVAMQEHAARSGYHVDHASDQELALSPEWARRTFSASVWAGANDDEYIASAMNEPPTSGRVWLSFRRGQKSGQADRFKTSLMQEVRTLWPETKELPILDGETIPLPDDLVIDGDRYILNPAAADRYNVPDAPSADPTPAS